MQRVEIMGDGLIAGYILDGAGGATEVGWEEIRAWNGEQGVLWVHLDYTQEASQRWVREDSGLGSVLADALLAEETRPRSVVWDSGLLTVLRGVNLNPGANPEDMVSIRVWVEPRRVISLRRRRLLSVDDVRGTLASGHGPRSAVELLADIAGRLGSRIADVIEFVDDMVDGLEEEALGVGSHRLRSRLAAVRREIIALRRYLAPQREALARIAADSVGWIDQAQRLRFREEADRVTRYVEDLDSARDRAAVTQEELAGRLSEQMNGRMYILSLVAGIFLPISFVTGLLGVNVGGIPAADNPWGFTIVAGILAVVTLLEIIIFKLGKWF